MALERMEEHNQNLVYVENEVIQVAGKTYVLHPVEASDSLQRLSIQYNVSANQIKIINGLPNDMIHHMAKLKIPAN